MSRIRIGQITSAVGIKGEIRVYPYLEQARFSDIKKIEIGEGEEAAVEKLRPDKNLLVMKLSSCTDRNSAEKLKGKYIYLPEGVKPDLGSDSYLISDLKGSRVLLEDGTSVGVIKDVLSRPVQDLYQIEKDDGSSFLLPAVKEFVLKVEPEEKTVTVRLIEGIDEL